MNSYPLVFALVLAQCAGTINAQTTRHSVLHDSLVQSKDLYRRAPVVERSPKPIHAPDNDPSLRAAYAALDRQRFRDRIGWATLSPPMKAALHDIAVGPDVLNSAGNLSFTRDWTYTRDVEGDPRETNDLVLHVDGDISVVGTKSGNVNADGTNFNRIQVTELQGSNDGFQGWTENWTREQKFNNEDGRVSGLRGVADLLGNTIVCGKRNNDEYVIWKFNAVDGTTAFSESFSVDELTSAKATDIAIDAEGLIYVIGSGIDASGSIDTFVARHDPDDGSRGWITIRNSVAEPNAGIEVDSRGNVYIVRERGTNLTIARLSPYDGFVEWSTEFANGVATLQAGDGDTLKLDPDGNPVLAHAAGSAPSWSVRKFDAETGVQLWNTDAGADGGSPRDLEIDDDGGIFVVGDTTESNRTLHKYTPDGTFLWSSCDTGSCSSGSDFVDEPATDVALDFLGNAYVAGPTGVTTEPEALAITRHAGATGTQQWRFTGEITAANDANFRVDTTDIIVDRGGNVYASGARTGISLNQEEGQEFYVQKLGQPYIAVPQIATSFPHASIEGGSLMPGLLGPQTLLDQNLVNQGVSGNMVDTVNDLLDPRIGVTGASIKTDMNFKKGSGSSNGLSDARVRLDAVATIEGGSYDADVFGELTMSVPSEDVITAGENVSITIDWTPDPTTSKLLARVNPEVLLELIAESQGRLEVDVDVEFDTSLSTTTVADTSLINANLEAGPATILELGTELKLAGQSIAGLAPGEWRDLDPDGNLFINGKVRIPSFEADSEFDDETHTFTSTLATASRPGYRFFDSRIRVTEGLLEAIPAPVFLFFNESIDVGSSGSGIEGQLKAGLIQLIVDNDIFTAQDLEMELVPYLKLDFEAPGGSVPESQEIDLVDSDGSSLQQVVDITMPQLPGGVARTELTINPTFGVRAEFRNKTGIVIQSSAKFQTVDIKAVLSVDLRDFALGKHDLLDKDRCIECFDIADFEIDVTPIDITDSNVLFDEDKLAKFRIYGNNIRSPQLSGPSVDAARMLIYDQRSPSQGSFDALASGTTPVLLYGGRFDLNPSDSIGPDEDSSGIETVSVEHHGRAETLTSMTLNAETILVNVPNRFFLLPGVMRFSVENDEGATESTDLIVEYPFPNLTGLQETYWASDPRWDTEPIIALDGGTPAGNDSFLSRRDYYTYLNDTLWSSAIMSGASNTALNGEAYFPEFAGWAASFPPAFPSITLDSVPLSRNGLDQTDGQFRAAAPDTLTQFSTFLGVQLANPSPGGGAGRVITIELPAPMPVVTKTNPSLFLPGETPAGMTVELVVLGPASVPFFNGFEGPKYGNFNPDSVIIIDGVDMPTRFISSGELIADVPASIVNTPGRKAVQVRTDNPMGTSYIDTVSGATISSGGTSPPLVLDVAWPAPQITLLSHSELILGEAPVIPIDIDAIPVTDDHNFTIEGEDFAPGCTVYVNGRQASSTRLTSGIVRTTIVEADVDQLGEMTVYVENPEPNRRISNAATVSVAAPE